MPFASGSFAFVLGRALLVCFAVCAVPATVAAQEVADGRDDEARSLHEAAVAAYQDGRYEAAMRRFQEAYDLSARPELLYNIGQSADRAGLYPEAIEALEAFLAEGEMGDDMRRTVSSRVDFLRERVAEERAAAPEEEEESASLASKGWFWAVVVSAAALIAGGIVLGVVLANDSADYTPSDLGETVLTLELGP